MSVLLLPGGGGGVGAAALVVGSGSGVPLPTMMERVSGAAVVLAPGVEVVLPPPSALSSPLGRVAPGDGVSATAVLANVGWTVTRRGSVDSSSGVAVGGFVAARVLLAGGAVAGEAVVVAAVVVAAVLPAVAAVGFGFGVDFGLGVGPATVVVCVTVVEGVVVEAGLEAGVRLLHSTSS